MLYTLNTILSKKNKLISFLLSKPIPFRNFERQKQLYNENITMTIIKQEFCKDNHIMPIVKWQQYNEIYFLSNY